jgi:hypothetical protein
MAEARDSCNILAGNSYGKCSLIRPRRRWDGNINIGIYLSKLVNCGLWTGRTLLSSRMYCR